MMQLVIEDNGCGFKVSAAFEHADNHKGFGLAGMQERLLLLGGDLEVESSIGAGTTIFARISFKSARMTV
jgi:signal transduction histidine kinase